MPESPDTLVAETERLLLRHLTPDDAPFILELLNERSFLENIGDRGVRSLEDARQYIRNGPMASYARHGFGLFLVTLKTTGESAGICGLLRREVMEDVDIGFAFLPRFWSKGYAVESATEMMRLSRDRFGIPRVVAVTAPHNEASARVLEKIGLHFERRLDLPDFGPDRKLFTPDGAGQKPA
ncbi:MAG: GNAT family N-acetyltransferase [Gemmatimonadaceae bacterium]